ncbi:MAG: UDP-N-acetylglucosamine 2-epimerase [Coriobacteriales bacterium]|nr:UDP-N-acetylglucosamine 2-epimerase [Coriobacteriales bacterium]
MRLIATVGARPNFVKIAPLIPRLQRADISVDIAYTGSRSARRRDSSPPSDMSFHGLRVPAPRWFLDIGQGTDAVMTGRAMRAFEEVFLAERPDAVMVIGDVSATLAAAVSAAKAGLPVVHLEAGLRCHDPGDADEVNRVLVTRIASMHLVPTEAAITNLEAEGVPPERIHFVGNILAEAVLEQLDAMGSYEAASAFGLVEKAYILGSFHRPENLRDPWRIGGLIEGLGRTGMPVIIPDAGPLRSALTTHGVQLPHAIEIVDAVTYNDMLALERDAAVIVTDSGGVQEEACMLGTSCVTVRDSTERQSTLACGCNRLAEPTGDSMVGAIASAIECRTPWPIPKRWDRAVSDRVVRALLRGIAPLK